MQAAGTLKGISEEKSFDSKLSGHEVYYTVLLVIVKHSCMKLHCQKV